MSKAANRSGEMDRRVPISAVVVTLNEEKNIERLLKSVAWADEIVVVDSYSEDHTVEIAKRYTDRVIQREFTDFKDQWSFAVSLCANDWLLVLGADEVVPPALRDEILAALEKGNHDGYYFPMAQHILGGWLKHGAGYPAYHIQLYRKSRGRWEGVVHEKVALDGSYGFLRNPILHYTHPNVSSFLGKTIFYSDLWVSALEEKPDQTLLSLFLSPLKVFIWSYVKHGGFLDGARGFVWSLLLLVNEAVLTAKIWEKLYMKPEPLEPPTYRLTIRARVIRLKRRVRDAIAHHRDREEVKPSR